MIQVGGWVAGVAVICGGDDEDDHVDGDDQSCGDDHGDGDDGNDDDNNDSNEVTMMSTNEND